ncbi:hypothetical protein Y1Q_0011784 [Alligator mississippiensis]|uniref:Uncharacterized protein n=1 Tax=Alligator mississippiensis TaxID=8496 RepID=A0A151M130_ALLMI|nr:hypothetical protein Y1Q_0011784 [Alligator mississippiensis]
MDVMLSLWHVPWRTDKNSAHGARGRGWDGKRKCNFEQLLPRAMLIPLLPWVSQTFLRCIWYWPLLGTEYDPLAISVNRYDHSPTEACIGEQPGKAMHCTLETIEIKGPKSSPA